MAKTQYLTYYVHVPDQALAASLVAQYPDGVNRAPYNAIGPSGMAVEAANLMAAAGVAAPNPLPLVDVDDQFESPALVSMWFTPSNTFPRDVATFTISSGWWIFGSSTKFYWIARFLYAPNPVPATDVDAAGEITRAALIPARHWLDGFEMLDNGELAGATGPNGFSRAGAILSEGYGFTNASAAAQNYRTHTYASGLTVTKVWKRVYLRLKRLPTVSTEIGGITNVAVNGSGLRLYITADGKLAVYTSTGTVDSLVSVYGTTPFTLGKRHRLDVVAYIGPNSANTAVEGTYAIFFDGGAVGTFTHAPGGLVANAKINDLRVGKSGSAPASTIEIDFDDWRAADWPVDKDFKQPIFTSTLPGLGPFVIGDLLRYDGPRPTGIPMPAIGFEMFRATTDHIQGSSPRGDSTAHPPYKMNGGWEKVTDSADWLGSRIVRLHNIGGTPAAGWTGDYRQASIPFQTAAATGGGLTSTTSAAILPLATDALTRLGNISGAQGWAAVQVSCLSKKTGGAADGSLGYKIGAAAAVYATITAENSVGGGWSAALYAPTALEAPEPFVAVEAHYKKGADANSSTVRVLLAEAEIIGNFSACDVEATGGSADTAPPLPRGLHNAPYPETPWFRQGTPPLSPVVIKAGTYTGNSTGQSLTFKAPVHWLWVRPLTGDLGGARFYSSAPNAEKDTSTGAAVGGFGLWARRDPTFLPASPTDDQQMQFLLEIPGADAQLNATGVTYQYVAFCDPGARFLLNGATYHENVTLPVSDVLEGANFLPEWGWFWRVSLSNATTSELWSKGAGHTAAQASKSSIGTPVASAVTWTEGTLSFDSGLIDATSRESLVYSLWRRHDGNNDPNEAKVVCFGTYTGDGTASRTVSIAPASGLRPLYVEVQPLNATTLHRDPSHTGTTSESVAGTANASTGITGGGIDTFSVGSVLNANGQTYNWFCILGSATAGNNGWSINGEYTPIAADSPVDTSYPDPPGTFDDTPEPEPEPTPLPADEPDLATACVDATQRVVNASLSRIGVSVQITALATELTQEAITARLHIKDDVDTVLKAIPWQRAKRRTNLVLVAGTSTTPVNNDWQYSYRAPVDMIRALRIASQTGVKRQYDPTRIAFEVGSDDTGDLIYTDADLATGVVQLEYTARPTCPAASLGAEFREALMWKHAASLAPALSKDPGKAAYCDGQYRDALVRFNVKDANEQAPQKPDDGDPDFIRGR
jgi:hypothetical protein